MLGELFTLEIAECPFTGGPAQAADCEETVVAAKSVNEGVDVALAEGVPHRECGQHDSGRIAWIAALFVGRVKLFDQRAGAGDHRVDDGFQEAVARFSGVVYAVRRD